MLQSSSKLPAPGRLFLPGCAIAAGLLAVSSPVIAAPTLKTGPKSALVKPAQSTSNRSKAVKALGQSEKPKAPEKAMSLRVGKSATYVIAKTTQVRVDEGGQYIFFEQSDEFLTIKALAPGEVRISLTNPDKSIEKISLNLTEGTIQRHVTSQVVEPAPSTAQTGDSNTNEMAPSTTMPAPDPSGGAALAPSALSTDLTPGVSEPAPPIPTPAAPTVTEPSAPAPSLPALTPAPKPVQATAARGPQISAVLPAPAKKSAKVNYKPTAKLPQGVGGTARQSINVTQGLARLLSFPTNILAVFFSDPNVMDARAINARTIAVTGVGTGPSTLAVFTSRYPGDAVGQANIYRIQTTPKSGQTASIESRDPRVVESTIASALGDPRIRTNVIRLPDGTLAARLYGSLRNATEVDAAKTTASFFVPTVLSSLYADANAPTLDAVLAGDYNLTPEEGLQENLRRISGNQSIELIPLPTGLGFKAEAVTADEAESLLRLLPTLNQQVIPYITVAGQQGAYNATVPLLAGEDRQLTQKLQDVTGVRTVYAVRTAGNALACYGTVRTRGEYDTVRRYMSVLPQTSSPIPVQGTSQGGQTLRPGGSEGSSMAFYNPTGGYRQQLGMQMFVRITDPGQSVIRKVTVQSNVVEINRTSMRNLGVEYGSVNLLSESITGGETVVTPNPIAGQPPIQTVNPRITTRTVDSTFNQGVATAGNGFIGQGGLGFINPFRARLNAMVQNGDARILSQPNVTSMEGSPAQITIGGERPVLQVVATQGAVGTQVEFRRYGVIISMRPTVTSENTILLQIRADVTQPDRTYEINLNGAIIPGETVRSVDTILNVKPGDTIVLGGLITNNQSQRTSKVPVLGDLPIIGSLFKSKQFENNQTELAIFLTPTLEAMPATTEEIEYALAAPSYPMLPSRQDANAILFQDTTRQQNN